MEASTVSTGARRAGFVTTSVDHPWLTRLDAESIRIFLRGYEDYCKEITARAEQLVATGTITAEPIRPVSLKYCIDSEQLQSALDLGFIEGVDDYESLSETALRSFLEGKAQESRKSLTASDLDVLVESELIMDMSIRSARSHMELLFMSYISLLLRNGIKWVLDSNQKLAVTHIATAVRPNLLRKRLESDLGFAHTEVGKNFEGFMKHALSVSDAFGKIDNGPNSGRGNKTKKNKPNTRGGGSSGTPSGGSGSKSGDQNRDSDTKFGKSTKSTLSQRPTPPCPFPSCKSKSMKHWIDDCTASTDPEKASMKADLAAAKERDGPARSSRQQTKQSSASLKATDNSPGRTVGRLAKTKSYHGTRNCQNKTTSCAITLSEGGSSLDATGRCDDCSDDSIVSPKIVERAAVQRIGKIGKITPVRLSVALKEGEDPQSFS